MLSNTIVSNATTFNSVVVTDVAAGNNVTFTDDGDGTITVNVSSGAVTVGDGVYGDVTVSAGGATMTVTRVSEGVVTAHQNALTINVEQLLDATSSGKALLQAADAATQREALGLGSAAVTSATDYATAKQGARAESALQPAGDGSQITGVVKASELHALAYQDTITVAQISDPENLPAGDGTDQTARDLAAAAQADADLALSGSAHDSIARATVNAVTTNAWIAAGDALATGVAAPDAVVASAAGTLTLTASSSAIQAMALTASQHGATMYYLAPGAGNGTVGSGTLQGQDAVTYSASSTVSDAVLIAADAAPALSAGDEFWIELPAVSVASLATGEEIKVTIYHPTYDDNPAPTTAEARRDFLIRLEDTPQLRPGLSSANWDPVLEDIPTTTVTDGSTGFICTEIATGVWNIAVRFEITAGQSVAAGWRVGLTTHTNDNQQITFLPAQFFLNTVPGASGSGGAASVADPAVGTHRTTFPAVSEAELTKPATAADVLKIEGDGGFSAKVRVGADGAVVLEVTTDNTRTATMPAAVWSTSQAARVTLAVLTDSLEPAAVLALNGVVVTGITLAVVPTTVTSYQMGDDVVGMTLTDPLDADGVPSLRAMSDWLMLEAEQQALPLQPAIGVDVWSAS